MKLRIALLAVCSLAQAACAADADVTPYRPSVSSPAQLPAAGQLELELGGLAARQAEGHRYSLPFTLKYAFSEEWGVLLGGEAWVSAVEGGARRGRSLGDTSVALKRAVAVREGTALGLELSMKLPTAQGSNKADYGVNGILSQDLCGFHLDANLNLVRMGAADAAAGSVQRGASLAASHVLAAGYSAVVEWGGMRRHGVRSTAQLLVAVSHSVSGKLVIDAGLAKGLTSATPAWSMFTGVAVALPR